MSLSFSVNDSLEDFEEFGLCDLSVSVFVYGSDELVDLLLADLSSLSHMFKGVVDQGGNLVGFKSSTLVLVISIEYGVHGVSKVLVAITHFSLNIQVL